MGTARNQGNDAILVEKARSGNADAWAELVERYSGYVYALLRSARVSEADQQDAFQYVFVELFKGLPSLRNTEHLAPWIRQTTLRHAIRLRKKTEGSPLPIDDLEVQDASADMVLELESAEQAQAVRMSIATLSDRCRELIKKLFFEDPPLPYVQVAELLGLKPTSLGMTRQRCLDDLEKSLRARGLS